MQYSAANISCIESSGVLVLLYLHYSSQYYVVHVFFSHRIIWSSCWHSKSVKVHNGLHHYISIVETVRKHIWIISFGAQTKKTVFRGADPAGNGQASLTNFVKCKNGWYRCVSLIELIKKSYMVHLVWSLEELIAIFGRFSTPDSH